MVNKGQLPGLTWWTVAVTFTENEEENDVWSNKEPWVRPDVKNPSSHKLVGN